MSIIPHKACKLAFGLQAVQGTPVVPTIMLPIHEPEDLNWRQGYSFFQYSDGFYNLRHYFSEGKWLEGSITMPLIPGAIAGDLGTWLWGRTGTYHQGRWATIYRDLGNGVVERYTDCKCISGTLTLDYGALTQAVTNVVGIQPPEATGAFAGTVYTAQPYLYNEASISLALGGGALGAHNLTRNHSLEFNNMTEAPADMGTLSGQVTPLHLPEAALAQWTGTLDELFNASALYDDFVSGQEGAYRAVFQRAGVATCTINFPRILWTENPIAIPNSGVVWARGVAFQALGSVNGLVDAFSLVETTP